MKLFRIKIAVLLVLSLAFTGLLGAQDKPKEEPKPTPQPKQEAPPKTNPALPPKQENPPPKTEPAPTPPKQEPPKQQTPPPKPNPTPPPNQESPKQTPPVKEEPKVECANINKVGEMVDNDIVSGFYQMATDRGKAIMDFLNQWKSPKGRIQYSDKLNLLIISDTRESLCKMEKLMEISNMPSQQIMIEALVIERIIKSDFQLGWESSWKHTPGLEADLTFHPGSYLQSLVGGGVPGGFQGSTIHFNTSGRRGTLDIKLRSMIEKGDAEILSSPRIMVANGEKAVISSGQEVPYQQVTYPGGGAATASVVYKRAEIKLEVAPLVSSGNIISLQIVPEVTTLSGYITVAGSETPYFATRKAQTAVQIKNGETITIGGLVREEDIWYERGIPFVSDIPLLGYLFKRIQKDKNKTEIIFILKPYIVSTPQDTVKPKIITEEHKEDSNK
ncbi:MAG: hypothetical protein HY811_08610 [Planctomycetes bacterium]|nr:hypothetical protein [Planctomycetota bacterium]